MAAVAHEDVHMTAVAAHEDDTTTITTAIDHEGDNDDAMRNDALMMTDDDSIDETMMADFLSDVDLADRHCNVRQVSDSTGGPNSCNNSDAGDSLPTPVMTGRPPILLYLSCNPDHLSEYQCLMRKHIELFEANHSEVKVQGGMIKGRNKPIVLGQVGIRCRFCAHLTTTKKARGAMYYSHTLAGIYQAAQILSQGHLLDEAVCPYVPATLREELKTLKSKKSSNAAGKEYWAATAKALGVYEDQHGLRFEERLGIVRH